MQHTASEYSRRADCPENCKRRAGDTGAKAARRTERLQSLRIPRADADSSRLCGGPTLRPSGAELDAIAALRCAGASGRAPWSRRESSPARRGRAVREHSRGSTDLRRCHARVRARGALPHRPARALRTRASRLNPTSDSSSGSTSRPDAEASRLPGALSNASPRIRRRTPARRHPAPGCNAAQGLSRRKGHANPAHTDRADWPPVRRLPGSRARCRRGGGYNRERWFIDRDYRRWPDPITRSPRHHRPDATTATTETTSTGIAGTDRQGRCGFASAAIGAGEHSAADSG